MIMQGTDYFLSHRTHTLLLVLSFKLQPLVLGLTAICPTALLLLFLVTAQAGTQLDVNSRRG